VHDVHTALVFASNARDVRRTIVAGEEIFRDGAARLVDEREIKTKMREIGEKMKI
jgi:cytosine/adenosine deaminase-related metal-dependent hydrolase